MLTLWPFYGRRTGKGSGLADPTVFSLQGHSSAILGKSEWVMTLDTSEKPSVHPSSLADEASQPLLLNTLQRSTIHVSDRKDKFDATITWIACRKGEARLKGWGRKGVPPFPGVIFGRFEWTIGSLFTKGRELTTKCQHCHRGYLSMMMMT